MTEEIYIDGVNVAGCSFYIQDYQRANNIEGRYEHCKDVCELNGDSYFYCKMNNECYYKQLKRLEQENKELLEKFNEAQDDIESLTNATNCYFKENKELKAYKDVNEDFKKAWDELNKKYTEVLKLAKENADSNEYCLQELEKENKKLKEEKLYRGIDRQFIEDANDRLYFEAEKYHKVLEEIREIVSDEIDKTDSDDELMQIYGTIYNKINEVLGC